MREKRFGFVLGVILTVLAIALMLPTEAMAASKYKVLHRFKDGGFPVFTSLIFDAAGNLYGTTAFASTHGDVFELKPNSDGSWTESVLYRFKGGADGAGPRGSLIFDTAGNLYGTTTYGGNRSYGTVFRLTPTSDGTWTKDVLHRFTRRDGANPIAGLIFDTAGNLYGTTQLGGAADAGVVFKLKPNADGSWTESVLCSFCSLKKCADGIDPVAGLIFDPEGNLYGTTASGGIHYSGVVFKLRPNSDGSWTESVLHRFADNPGADPVAGLAFDSIGNLYGTASNANGSANGGAVFKMTPNSTGGWEYGTLHVFRGKPALHPAGGLILDNTGDLYGTTSDCGSGENCQGVIFEITP
jgi:uncharacterized repeat protein (TIGR03803 family)